MIPIALFAFAVVFAFIHHSTKKSTHFLETLLSYIIFFNIGAMGILGFYAHVFMADTIAEQIGWPPGNPFQFEIGMANLAFGILGILSLWYRGLFWMATIIGCSVLFLGAFVGHIVQYLQGNTAPYNIGVFIWFGDLILPLLYLSLLFFYLSQVKSDNPAKYPAA